MGRILTLRPNNHAITATRALPFLIVLAVLWCSPVPAATPYKTYVIKRYKNWDILCDSYRVQRGDYVWELLRRRGCIVDRDLAQFTALLKRLNPHIRNVNRIYPGQRILIPLKQMEAQAGADDRWVTIPFLPDILHSMYTVQPGDYVWKIAAKHHGLQTDQIPDGYLQVVKQINPDIKDLNRIYPGQKIRIPEIGSQGRLSEKAVLSPPSVTPPAVSPSSARPTRKRRRSAMSLGVEELGGRLVDSGEYFFPVKGRGDVKLDLAAFPVIELEGGRRILLDTGKGLPAELENTIRAFWKPLTIVQIQPGESRRTLLDKVLRAIFGGEVKQTVEIPIPGDGVHVTLRADWILVREGNEPNRTEYHCITLISHPEERTSAALRAYLREKNIRISDLLPEGVDEDSMPRPQPSDADKPETITIPTAPQEAFVGKFVKAMGYSYDRRVPLTFQYAGFQIETTANLMHGEDGLDAVVDFGTLYGDSKAAIEKSGLKVVSIKPEDELLQVAQNMLHVMGIPWTEDPVFFGADRDVFKATSITVSGLLTSRGPQRRTMLTLAPLSPKVCDFLGERKIKVLKAGRSSFPFINRGVNPPKS